MSCNPHIQLVLPKRTTDEFPLVRDMDAWEKAFAKFVSKFPGDKSIFQFSRFLPHFGSAWLAYLIDTFSIQPGHVFLKDPNVNHIDWFFDLFPGAKLLLLVRDGRDNVASSVRAAQAKRRSDTLYHRSKSGLNRLLRRDFLFGGDRLVVGRPEDREIRRALPSDSLGRAVPDRAIRRRLPEPEGVGSAHIRLHGSALRRGHPVPSGRERRRRRVLVLQRLPERRRPQAQLDRHTQIRGFSAGREMEELEPSEKRAFKRIAGRELVRMGYEKSPDWV